MIKTILAFCALIFLLTTTLVGQKLDNTTVSQLIEKYKADTRGPYKDIRWFCKDGAVLEPKEKCKETGGIQRARYKTEVEDLGVSNHVFLGQILANTPFEDFWDAENYNSRLKQYQLEKFLRAADNGWVLEKGQYYRGAFQVEYEEAWGMEFLIWLMENDAAISKQYYLVRQAVKDIPHQGDNDLTLRIRAISKQLAENYTPFENLRVKIHGQPDASDIAAVKAFMEKHQAKIKAGLIPGFNKLLADMGTNYQPVDLKSLNVIIKKITWDSDIRKTLTQFVADFDGQSASPARTMAIAEKMWAIRNAIPTTKSRKARLALFDMSIALESIFFRDLATWETKNTKALQDKICYTGLAAAGAGLVETHEWAILEGSLATPLVTKTSLAQLNHFLTRSRSLVEWSAGMTRGVYQDVVNLYSGFEPLAYGFYDDRIRSSVLLNLGKSVGDLGDIIAKASKLSNQVMDIANQSHARGLNPGYAMGELVVVNGSEESVEVSKDKIYIFNQPPADLKPIAGIATVTEGNLVSHVQLLVRNLGIPNAVVSNQNLNDLLPYSGQKVFFAVSNKGTVIMKLASEMTATERQLFVTKKREEVKISVPTEKIDLSQTTILNLRNLDATASGKTCGPKAANLGQLKVMFPKNVVEGLVIPFGIFRAHLDQSMPNQSGSYWDYLEEVFQKANQMRTDGETEEAIENYQLSELETLRNAIKNIPLTEDFLADLDNQFTKIFGKDLGNIPVFLRSDTNMEDLKDFTGAGLNLTLFNVVDKAKIIQGIKDVWASPYTERSFKWRQRYLLNPENVFPSILVIPSVDVDYSGVLITKGVTTGKDHDLTIAFSRGAGGAVDGQAAESYILGGNGKDMLLSPAREPFYRSLPITGGTKTNVATFDKPVLNAKNLYRIKVLANEVKQKMPSVPGVNSNGPFDVELGFKNDKLWLFQIRPFVENKNALTSTYLESITPIVNEQQQIAIQ